VADLQRLCEVELGHAMALGEAEDLGQRILTMFALLFEVHERHVHRSARRTPLTEARTNGTL
jgi:hypothetical protein